MSLLFERQFDYDPAAGISRVWHQDYDGRVVLETTQDVSDIVDEAKNRDRMFRDSDGWRGDLHRIASIPTTILMKLYKDGVVDDPKRFKKWLNDRDNRVFRTRPGRV